MDKKFVTFKIIRLGGYDEIIISPNRRYILLSSIGIVYLLDAENGIEIHRFTEEIGRPNSLAFSSDERHILLSNSYDIKILNIPTNTVIPTKTNLLYVNDFANVISEANRKHMSDRSIVLNRNKNVQIIFTTVTNTGTLSMEDYSIQMWQSWIGDANSNSVLFIIRITSNRFDWQLRWGNGNIIRNIGGDNILNTVRRVGNDFSIYRSYNEGIKIIYDAIHDMF